MDSNCLQCSKPVKSLKFIQCQGFCNKVVHLECASLTRANMDFINENKNLFWFCNDCTVFMNSNDVRNAFASLSEAFRNLSDAHRSTLEEVKTELEKNREQIQDLSSKISVAPAIPVASMITNPQSKPNQFKRTLRTVQLEDIPELSCGKKKIAANIAQIPTVAPEPEKCWVYLSRISPKASEDDVLALVTECIPCDEPIEVRKLVKKGTDLSALRFISFKIVGDMKYREVALSADSWPDGVYFREFVNYQHEKTETGFSKSPRLD